jgi:predicted RNase H-like HicB family nuclease
MKYLVLFERAADGGIWGFAPELPGATGMGDTMEEAQASVLAGITAWIEDARQRGEAIPEPTVFATEMIDVPVA